MSRLFRPAIAGAMFSGAVLLGAPATASAHASLEASTPAPNSVLETAPAEIVLDFDDPIELALASIELFDSSGDEIAIDNPRRGDDQTKLISAVPALADGLYAVIWHATSADGHPLDGSFSFQIGTASANVRGDELIDQVRDQARAPASVRWAYGIARFLSVLGAVTLVGAGGWLLTGARAANERALARRCSRIAAAVFLFGSTASFGLFATQAAGGTIGDAFNPSVWGDVTALDTGRALLLRVVLAAILLALVVVWHRRQHGWWRGAAATAGVLAVATFPLAGHPNSLSPRWWWFFVDFVHLAAITVWVGGLCALLLAGREVLASTTGERMARRFSSAATLSVPLIVASGVLQTWRLAGGFDDVAASDWGRVLLVKITTVVILLAIAAVSRWLLLHEGSGSIRRTMVVEAAIAIAVLGLTAGMVGLPPAPAAAAKPFATQLVANGVIVEVTLGPGSVGSNELHVVVSPPGGSIVPVVAVAARVALPSEAAPSAPVQLARESGNHYRGSVAFLRPGEWELEIIVEVTPGETVLVKTSVPIP